MPRRWTCAVSCSRPSTKTRAATAEFEKASGILGGLWEKLRARPEPYLDPATMDAEGLDAAARDFLAGMTDRYAVSLFEELFVPRSWVELAVGCARPGYDASFALGRSGPAR